MSLASAAQAPITLWPRSLDLGCPVPLRHKHGPLPPTRTPQNLQGSAVGDMLLGLSADNSWHLTFNEHKTRSLLLWEVSEAVWQWWSNERGPLCRAVSVLDSNHKKKNPTHLISIMLISRCDLNVTQKQKRNGKNDGMCSWQTQLCFLYCYCCYHGFILNPLECLGCKESKDLLSIPAVLMLNSCMHMCNLCVFVTVVRTYSGGAEVPQE